MMQGFIRDVQYAARVLRRSPGFTAIAIVALALGIGANTAIFSLVDGVLLRPLPYRDPARLAVIWEQHARTPGKVNVVAPANFLRWQEMNTTFSQIAAVSPDFRTTLTGAGDPVELPVEYVSGSLLSVLGVRPAIGRDFLP